jgi:hypothetical protein
MHCDGIRIMEALLAFEGIGADELELAEVTHDLGNLTSGRWDAVQGYAVAEPVELAARGVEVETLPLRAPALHPYAQVLFAAGLEVRAHTSLYARALAATFEGWRRALADHKRAIAAVQAVGVSMGAHHYDDEGMRRVASLVSGVGEDGASGLGRIDPARWARNVAAYASVGIVPAGTAPDCALDTTIWARQRTS